MSVRITWSPNTEVDVVSYRVEKAASAGGPWSLITSVANQIPGPNWEAESEVFFFYDPTGTEGSWYRLVAIDVVGQKSTPTTPFRAGAFPLTAPTLVNSFSVVAGNVSSLLDLGYKTVEIWESHDDSATWTEITSSQSSPATLLSIAGSGHYKTSGKSIYFKINGGQELLVAFANGPQFISAAQLIAAINAVAPGFASLLGSDQRVRLATEATGRASSIEILYCDIPELGFAIGKTFGRDARLELIDTVSIYNFYDAAGLNYSRYKWRFSDDGAAPLSQFSKYLVAKPQALLDPTALSVGVARFVGPDGTPTKRRLVIVMEDAPKRVGPYSSGNSEPLIVESDDMGFLQVPLVKGLHLKVALEGTSLIQDLVVPDAPTFDFFDSMTESPSRTTIQAPAPLLTRRSL
jgi:hypothetical protein